MVLWEVFKCDQERHNELQGPPPLPRSLKSIIPTKMFGYTRIAALLTGLSSLLAVAALPLESFNLTDTAKHFLTERAKNAVPGAPRFVVYGDRFVSGITGPPPVNDVRVNAFIFRRELIC